MTRMTIVVDVPEVNPTYWDPKTLAENVIYSYSEDRDVNGKGSDYPEVKLVSAEWEAKR